MDSPSQRFTSDYPKPQAGLAEWTSKIKAIQREVDADEETEQKRLEDEIRASRLARSRRSIGTIGAAADLSNNPTLYLRDLKEATKDTETNFSNIQREHDQSDALRRLIGQTANIDSSSIRMPSQMRASDKVGAHAITRAHSTPSSAPAIAPKPEPVSLAAFIGGRATGPRLNKHAPQQDAHDPTQFEQRTLASVTQPHPIFGRGGVAMPGMSGKTSVNSVYPTDKNNNFSTSSSASDKPVWMRENQLRRAWSQETRNNVTTSPDKEPFVAPIHENKSSRNVVSDYSSTGPKPEDSRPPFKNISRDKSPERGSVATNCPQTPNQLKQKPTSPVTTPSLARPLQPQVRPSPTGPQIPISPNPSPAFLKPPAAKETTPSLSRLQGRGFVKNVVKKSSELEGMTPPGNSPISDNTGRKKPSVLERWPPSPSPSPSHQTSPVIPDSINEKTNTVLPPTYSNKPFVTSPKAPQAKSNVMVSPPPIKPKPQLPPKVDLVTQRKSFEQKDNSTPAVVGLGSSNTLISYIKPTKTGEQAPTEAVSMPDEVVGELKDVDELGVRTKGPTEPLAMRTELAKAGPPAGRLLTHPTKDRPKKPRKAHNTNTLTPSLLNTNNMQSSAEKISNISSRQEPSSNLLNSNIQPVVNSTLGSVSVIPIQEEKRAKVSPSSSYNNDIKDQIKPSKFGKQVLLDLNTLPITPPLTIKEDKKPPASPNRHSRIPSTGSRARVMEVAQAMEDQAARESLANITPTVGDLDAPGIQERSSPVSKSYESIQQVTQRLDSDPSNQSLIQPVVPNDKRRSSYEKYSSIIMPPLREENTPSNSPAVTLSKSARGLESVVEHSLASSRYEITDQSLPYNVQDLWNNKVPLCIADPDINTISVELLNIVTNNAIPITHDTHIFYDSETIALIHRAKRISTNLVFNEVWGWLGQNRSEGSLENTKLRELAKRYNTNLLLCEQYAEPEDFIRLLGGTFAVRRGIRHLWSGDNSSMYIIRCKRNLCFIDELDISVSNLCSGFSFCISLLDRLWVWHGRGSTNAQRNAALIYAETLLTDSNSLVEMEEGQEEEYFSMLLGTDDYANADYWRWRAYDTAFEDIRVWEVNRVEGRNSLFTELLTFPQSINPIGTILVINLIFETFVMITAHALEHRDDIRLALRFAEDMSGQIACHRPFLPPVHVIVLPSRIPLELLASVRGLSEEVLNDMNIPDEMNILTAKEAYERFLG